MSILLSVSIALLAGLLMTRAFKPLKLPSVTAYLIAGIIVGPYCLGQFHVGGLGFESIDDVEKLRAVSEEVICRFEFAYAITCHKAQGSEFDFVIVFDESWAFGEERNRWLYTAITRAKEKLLIIR